ncbi:MAG TPA: ribonuclease Y, partial [Phycisphaerales bacterium]|nr:ribonuclease Y [Phycisphaerales bacterium]
MMMQLAAVEAIHIGFAAGGLVVGAVAAIFISKFMGAQTLGNAKKQSDELLSRAKADAQTIQKQIELDARNELAKRREKFESELEGSRNEVKETERRLIKREDNLDRKLDVLTTKEKYLDDLDGKIKSREKSVAAKEAELDSILVERKELLEKAREEQKQVALRMANMTEDEARRESLRLVEQEVQHEAAQLIQKSTMRAEEEAKDNALKITLQAIQRYASEHTADTTVNAIPIPSDDMKGRVIGREGRNIRAFEKATGVDVIVDDTPGVVVVSCFDPVRRAIAAEALVKLLDDGRIHPSRIEEIVEQIQKEMGQRIVKFGKEACIEANIQGLHPKISEA